MSETTGPISILLGRNVPPPPSTKIIQAVMTRRKTWPLGDGAYFPYISILKIFLSETTGPISILLGRNVPWWPSTKIVQAVMIRQKTWPPGGGAYFALYIYTENFKNLLVRNHRPDFILIGRNVPWWTSTKIVQAVMIRQKTWPPSCRACFEQSSCRNPLGFGLPNLVCSFIWSPYTKIVQFEPWGQNGPNPGVTSFT